VQRQTFLLDLEAQAAFKDVGAFLQAVQVELSGILTTVGVSDSMSSLVASAARVGTGLVSSWSDHLPRTCLHVVALQHRFTRFCGTRCSRSA
jgi:hypothetical protein